MNLTMAGFTKHFKSINNKILEVTEKNVTLHFTCVEKESGTLHYLPYTMKEDCVKDITFWITKDPEVKVKKFFFKENKLEFYYSSQPNVEIDHHFGWTSLGPSKKMPKS
jgi:hypothetical protein